MDGHPHVQDTELAKSENGIPKDEALSIEDAVEKESPVPLLEKEKKGKATDKAPALLLANKFSFDQLKDVTG